jgi:hypothetical protein
MKFDLAVLVMRWNRWLREFGVYCVLLLSVLHAWAGVSVLNFSGSRFTSYATLDVMSELQVFLRITDSTFSISCSSHRYHIYYTSVLLVTRDVVCRKRWRERKRGTVHDPFGTAVLGWQRNEHDSPRLLADHDSPLDGENDEEP